MEEQWKEIEGFDSYMISNLGSVKSFKYKKERILKAGLNTKGYFYVILRKDRKSFAKRIHRLVAEAFLPRVEQKEYVNHKNGIKTDNTVLNLEWCTKSENTQHAFDLGLLKPMSGKNNPKFVGYYHTPYGVFESASAAAKAEKCSNTKILYRTKSKKYTEYYLEKVVE